MKNTKIMTLFALVAILSVSSSQIAFGAQLGGKFTSGTQKYYCTTNLTNDIIVSNNVSTCNDLAYAAGKWNNISQSTWSFTENTSSASSNIDIWTQYYSYPILAKVTHSPSSSGPTYTDAYMKFSNAMPFGDIGSGDPSTYNDYESVAIHEFGHIAGIAHYGTQYSVMYNVLPAGTEKESLYSPDLLEIRNLY